MISAKLLDVLTKIEILYNKLIELASLKKEAILISNYDQLVKITGLEQKCAAEIEAAEKERINTVDSFLKEKGMAPNTGLTAIIKSGLIDGGLAEAINTVKDRLIKSSAEIKTLNEENNLLISSSRDIIEKSLEFVKNKIAAGSKSPLNKTGAYSNLKKNGSKPPQAPPANTNSTLLDFIV
jgi:hypothetical protein